MKRAVVLCLSLVAALLPVLPARSAPTIKFLNPSGYSPRMVISDQPDSDSAVHFVAWVGQVPPSPLVEFEVQPPNQNPQTIDAQRVGSTDAWEAFYSIPDTFVDGTYILRVRLYSNLNEVANAEESVMVDQTTPPPAADTVEITYPANGATVGFYTPKGGKPNTVMDVKSNTGSERVRGLYTTSAPGTEPQWSFCGAASPDSTNGTAKLQCTLSGNDQPSQVTALAAVANNTPAPGDPNAQVDDSGDAHRVTPYTAVPTSIQVSPDAIANAKPGECTGLISARVSDQTGRPIAAANVDVHGTGPNDQLRFGTADTTPFTSSNDDFKEPDAHHISTEAAVVCSDGSNSGKEGVHHIPGQSDPKHIESVTGTSKSGIFTFVLRSESPGGTTATVWVDQDDDDQQQASEASGGARIGWGQAPPPPQDQVFLDPSSSSNSINNCQAINVFAKRSGGALVNQNIDIHVKGPDGTIHFCDPNGGTTVPRAPDQGGHIGDKHEDGTLHGEGETDGAGKFVFGITSASKGDTDLLVWIDETDDDTLTSNEPTATGDASWVGSGNRTASLSTRNKRVSKGTTVKLRGRLDGDPECSSAQSVKLQARRASGGRFHSVATTQSGGTGSYVFKRKMKRSTTFRAVAPATSECAKATSGNVTVRVRS